MASPFSVFRKNQKVMLAVVGIMAMIAFVFIPTWGGGSGADRRGDDPQVVTWKYGTLHESDIQRMQQWNNVLNQFVEGALQTVVQGRFPLEYLGIRPFPTDEESVVRMMLMARQAEKLGLEVGDEAINAYIKRTTMDSVDQNQLREVVSNLRIGDRRVSEGQLFDALRTALLARNYENLMVGGLGADPPAARWDAYVKLNRPVTAHVLPVPVADFIGQVEEPSDRELRAFYDEHKDRVDQPMMVQGVQLAGPEPGFKIPYRAQFSYVSADKAALVKKMVDENKFTEEEIKNYYNANKYKFTAPPQAESTTDPSPPNSAPLPEDPSTETSAPADAANENSDKPESTSTTDVNPEANGGPNSPVEDPRDQSSPEQDTSPESPDQTDTPAPEKEGAATIGSDDNVLALADSTFLAQADAPETDVKQEAAGERRPDQPNEPPVNGPSDTPVKPAGEQSADVKPSGEGTTPAKSPSAPAKVEPTYRPLEDVREEIKQDLAELRVAEQIDKSFEAIRSVLTKYNDRLVQWSLEEGENSEVPKPKEPDLAELANQYQLEFTSRTRLMTARQATQDPAFPSDRDFMEAAFNEQLPVYRPIRAADIQDNQYLVWKVDQRPSQVPALEDIHDEVVRAWKIQQARSLAQEAAEKKAEEARQKGAPLVKVFGESVIEIGPFTAATTGDVPAGVMAGQQPRLTELPKLDNAGPEFMDVVADLQSGEIGVAMNHPRTIAYVVQVNSTASNPQVLRSEFAARTATNYQSFAQVSLPAKQEAYQAWLQQLEKEADLRWLRPPRGVDL